MMTIPDAAFWIINIVLIVMFVFSMAFGWEHGGKRTLADIFRTVLQIALTLLVTLFLTMHFSLFNLQTLTAYLNTKPDTPLALDPVEVNKFRFYRSGVIWFFVALIGVELIFAIVLHIYRRRHKNDPKKQPGKTDRVIGEILGGVLFLFWITLLSPVFVSAEKENILSNGSDIIHRTVLKYPVNYAAKPLTRLILRDNPAADIYDQGLRAIVQGVRGMDQWIEAHCQNVREITDLTAIFTTEENSLSDTQK